MKGIDKFMEVWEQELRKLHAAHPENYAYEADRIPVIVMKFRRALESCGYSKDNPAFKATVKLLGIKNTYAAIDTYLGSEI